ncbi:calcium/sodium antiporter [Glaciecola sp. SC05]|uniref:calcium/sodium antiporter n=1 Tax=Glaciecola sp. SC05 TaxID=1987355 RepID=UPI00352750D7
MIYIEFAVGLLLLIISAQVLLKGAVALATDYGIPPLIVGLTIVAFGTSAPELAVSVQAALTEQTDVALGNVIGSNLFNVLFIMGLCALILPLKVSAQLVKQDIPILLALTLLVYLFALDQLISRFNALILIILLIAYLMLLLKQSKNTEPNDSGVSATLDHISTDKKPKASFAQSFVINMVLVIGGIAGLAFGSNLLVSSSVAFAKMLGISELLIGLTVLAIGTSLPEIVTSLIAVFNKQRDIAVGNIIGSNIFNLVAVLGVTGLVSSAGIPVSLGLLEFEFPFLIVFALFCLPIAFSGYLIDRKEGFFFLAMYMLYSLYLWMNANAHPSVSMLYALLFYVLIPIAALLIAFDAYRHCRERNKRDKH